MTGRWGDAGWSQISCLLLEAGILRMTLDRPQQLNAFTPVMCAEMIAAFTQASDDDDVRAIVVTGAGRAFCAGMDLGGEGNVFGIDETKQPSLKELRANLTDPAYTDGVLDLGGRLTRAINRCAKPIAAAINGPAIGIGATMTLAMDFRLAAPEASIGFVFNRIGIVPEACSSYFLPTLVGPQQALEWLYRATPIPATEALEGRLVRSIHSAETLLDDTIAFMRGLTEGRSALAQSITRQLVQRKDEATVLEAHLRESLAMHWLSSRDGKEGVGAFMEKRAAQFSGRPSCDLPPDFGDWFAC